MSNISNYDVTIVLGNGVFGSKIRAMQAANLTKNLDSPIVVTGGIPITIPFLQSPNGFTEAEIMQKVLKEQGISESRIYREPTAQSTLENFTNSKGLIKKLGGSRIAIVTGKAHLPRALKIAKKIFPSYEIGGFPTPLTKGNLAANLAIEGISYMLEKIHPFHSDYRIYNNQR